MSGEMMFFPATVEEFMEQYKVVDRDHALSNGAEFVPVFRMRQWFDHLQAPPITNADRIRSMSDEELADWLGVYCNGQTAQEVGKPCASGMGSCEECWLDWLKGEAEGDT